tara:strand:- start:865 stop:1641 length:777 start_codon:yes stop_codon:yes gene_type:complete
MRLDTNWILQEPIDLEHKQYVLLDYINKVDKDFDNFKLYPSFQELSVHLANIGSIRDKSKYITINREPTDIDDEILLDDLVYHNLNHSKDTKEEILKIIKFSQSKLTDLFLIGKSIWSLLYDDVSIRIVFNDIKKTKSKSGVGFFYIVYDEVLHIYQYRINTITTETNENKCSTDLIYKGDVVDVTDKKTLINLIRDNAKSFNPQKTNKFLDGIEYSYPIFRVKYEQKFPLEGSILSIAKRKIMNYIFQTIKIQELKS